MQCSLKFKKQEPNNSSQLPREKAYLIYIYIYIYKTEVSADTTIFHVSTTQYFKNKKLN